MSGLRVLALFGQNKHSRIDNGQTEIVASELAKGGVLYRKDVFFNIFINLPSFLLYIIPVWMLIKHMDDFKDIDSCDAIVVSGKKMIRFARHLRHYMFPDTKIVQIGNPVCKIRKNDILIRQATSKFVFNGKNVLKVNGLLCKKIDTKFAEEKSQNFERVRNILKGEYIGVFIDVNKYFYTLTLDDVLNFAKIISCISYGMKMPLLIYIDGKMDSAKVDTLKKNLNCSYYFYEKQKDKDNPKVAFMHWSRYYVLLGNLINNHSEYISQGKPTYIYLAKKNSSRYLSFVNSAVSANSVRLLSSDSEKLDYFVPADLNDIDKLVRDIKSML